MRPDLRLNRTGDPRTILLGHDEINPVGVLLPRFLLPVKFDPFVQISPALPSHQRQPPAPLKMGLEISQPGGIDVPGWGCDDPQRQPVTTSRSATHQSQFAYVRSSAIAMPWPTPMHIVASARSPLHRISSIIAVPVIRAPDMPKG